MASRIRIVYCYDGRAYPGYRGYEQAWAYYRAGFGMQAWEQLYNLCKHLSKVQQLMFLVKEAHIPGNLYFFRDRRGIRPKDSLYIQFLREYGVRRMPARLPEGEIAKYGHIKVPKIEEGLLADFHNRYKAIKDKPRKKPVPAVPAGVRIGIYK